MAEGFGDIVVRLGFATAAHVQECAKTQEERRRRGEPPGILGELMVAKGYLNRKQVVEVMRQQAQAVKEARVVGGFRIVEELGRGATGVIYRALQISLDREVALKVLSAKHAHNERVRDRFLKEARTVGRLRHPNIVQGIDVGSDGATYYMAMEYIDGPTIGELLRRGGALDEKRAVRIVAQVADALAYAHENGIMHRDIKPDNIMLTADGIAKLCDLGLARMTSPEGDDAEATRQGTTVGTPHYISPEQARGEATIDIRADLYSLGATFYHMVTGTPPFPGPSAVQVIARHLSEDPEPPRKRNPLVSAGVEQVILKMLKKSPADRYSDPKALLEDLKAVAAGGHPAGAAPPAKAVEGPAFRGRRISRRGRLSRLRRR